MLELADPNALSEADRYKQLNRILKKGSRGSNPDWYRHACDLDAQLHLIRRSNTSLDCWHYHKPTQSWKALPSLPVAALSSPERVQQILQASLSDSLFPKAKSLGVIVHCSTDFATSEVPLSDANIDWNLLRQRLIYEPTEALQDNSLSDQDFSWRLVPYPEAPHPPHASAAVTPRQYSAFAQAINEYSDKKDIPIRFWVLSSPLTLLRALPSFIEYDHEQALVVLIPFESFTCFSIFDKSGNLRMLRSLQGRLNPALVIQSIRTSTLAIEITDFQIAVINLDKPNPILSRSLKKTFVGVEPLSIQIQDLVPEADGQAICYEAFFAVATLPVKSQKLSNALSFRTWQDSAWGLPNFSSSVARQEVFFPSLDELSLVRKAKKIQPLVAIFALVSILGLATWMFFITQSEAWKFNPTTTADINKKKASILEEQKKATKIATLLDDRSRAWTVLEFFNRLRPNTNEIYFTNVEYQISPDTLSKTNVGFVRSWKIEGLGTQSAISKLQTREEITKLFNDLAELTGDQSFKLEGTNRILSPQADIRENAQRGRTKQNANPNIFDPSTLERSFTLSIEQSFGEKDSLAIPK